MNGLLSKKHAGIIILCILFFCLDFYAFCPGFLMPDTIDQYTQASTGVYNDWHPPMMAFVWHLLLHISDGPGVMLALQLLFLWISCGMLLSCFPQRAWQICIILFCWSPVVQNFAGYLIKDVHMAFSWLLAFSIMLRGLVSGRKLSKWEVFFTLTLLTYGTCVRINALPGALPLFYMLIVGATNIKSKVKAAVTAFVVCVGVLATVLFVQNKTLRPEKTYPEFKLYLQDLSGIFLQTNENVFPAFLYENPAFDTAYIRANFTTATFDDIADKRNMFEDDDSIKVLEHAWKHAITQHPATYLNNRYDGFLYFLRIKNRANTPFNYYCYYTTPNQFGFKVRPNPLYNAMLSSMKKQADAWYMKPWFWALLNVVLLFCIPLVKDKKYQLAIAVLGGSSLFYLLPQIFIFQIDTDFRYFYWNCIACLLALILFLFCCFKHEKRAG